MKNIIEWLYLRQKGNLVYYDRLSQLLNRNWWEMYAKSHLEFEKLFITIIDLDDLKKINDTEGHEGGDNLIQRFSKILKIYFPKDKIVRLGGDEFLIISKDMPIERLIDLTRISIKFSFGVCIKNKDMTLSDALKNADVKMYRMKSWHKE